MVEVKRVFALKLIFTVFLALTIVGCEKNEKTYRIRYEIKFLSQPPWYSFDWIDFSVSHHYPGEYNNSPEIPAISNIDLENGYWIYDYWELKEGDDVYFHAFPSAGYVLEMNVYIDGQLVASEVSENIEGFSPSMVYAGIADEDTPGIIEFKFIPHEVF